MKYNLDNEKFELSKKYLQNQSNINELNEIYQKESDDLQKIDELSTRLEKNVNTLMIDIRALEKQKNLIKTKIEQRKLVNEPEKNQIKDINTFVYASKSIFTAKAFSNLENDPSKQEALQGRSGDVLIDIAKISENVIGLRNNIFDLKRAEIGLKDLKSAEKNKRLKEITTEIDIYNKNTVKVRYKNLFDKEETCDFPMTDHLGNKLKFENLLENACRYWDLFQFGNVLLDEDFLVWPGSKYVADEIKDITKEVWIMSKEEANYFKAVKTKEKTMVEEEIENNTTERHINYSEEIEDEVEKEKDELKKNKETEEHKLLKERERNKNALNLLIYGLFIVLFTWSLLQSNQVESNFYANAGFSNLLLTVNFPVNSSAPNYFYGINIFQDFKNFLNGPLLNSFFQTYDYNGNKLSIDQMQYVTYSYKKLGTTRFLQKKTKIETCKTDLSDYLGRENYSCYQILSLSNEYTDTLSIPELLPNYTSWLQYQHVSNPRSITGTMASYDLEGYIAYIDPSTTIDEASNLFYLIINNWIDLQTRMLAIHSNFCNFNVDICISVELLFEFIAGGGVIPTVNILTYRVNLAWKALDKIRIAFDVISASILLYFLIAVIYQAKLKGLKIIYKSFWNLALLLLIIMTFIKQMAYLAYQNLDKIKNFNEHSTEFVDYMSVAIFYKMISNFTGICSFFTYFYVLSFFQESKSLKVVWGTLKNSMYRLLFFFFVFLLVFIGWMLLAYKGFGQYLADYRNLGNTASTLLQMLLGNVNFQEIYSVQHEFAGLFFFLFIFLDYFIMLNVFLAIINEAYDTVYKRIKINDDPDEMLIIFEILLKGAAYSFFTMPWQLITCQYCKRKKNNQFSNSKN